MDAVSVRGLVVRHPGGFELAVDAWSVGRGARAAVVGPSGSGKTTLLSVLAGARSPDAGEVEVLGERLDRLSDPARRAWRVQHVGRVLQDLPLLDGLDVRDNVLLPFRLHPALRLDAAARGRADALLDRLGLAARADRAPATLSQGERQRVAVARALVTGPGLVLADEPTTGLDPARASAVVDLVERSTAEAGATLIVVTHDPALADRMPARLDLGRSA